ncbi:MAG: sigma-E processing peptidase SpoIIGA [Firmicutes bacterium]|nr:sigma-E processing peptidase SpoIIGA [Bacillota bacterium]
MNVYVEYVILDNFVIDTLLLWAAALTLKLPYKRIRLILGGALGALCVVVSVFIAGAAIYLIKTFSLVIMCAVAVGFGKKLFWHILLTAAYTFVSGGAVVAVFHFFNLSYITENGEFYQLNVPLSVYVTAAALTAFLCYSVVFYIRQVKRFAPYVVKATVSLDKDYALDGYCDSGNTLTFNGLPVCFVTKRFNGFAAYFAQQSLKGNTETIEVVTVAGSCKVTAVKGTVSANGIKREAYLALPAERCKTLYHLVLSREFLDERTTATVAAKAEK